MKDEKEEEEGGGGGGGGGVEEEKAVWGRENQVKTVEKGKYK